MRLADKDLNAFTPIVRRNKILKEVNKALESMDRINDQIKIWDLRKPDHLTIIMKDELKYLKEGKL